MRRAAPMLLLALAACASQPAADGAADTASAAAGDSGSVAAEGRELGRRWAAWRAARPDRYRFVYVPRCFCPPARLTIEVRGDSARIVGASGDELAVARLRDAGAPTVDSLFAQLDDALQAEPAEMRVTYDEALHYPREAWVDRDRAMADEEFGFEVDSLARIE